MMTFMSSCAQRLLNNFPTVGTILAAVVGRDGNRYHSKHLAEILQPVSESRPSCVTNRFRQLPVLNHVPHHQVDLGNQVVRLDDASCQLHGKIFTLPTYLEVLCAQPVLTLGSIFRALLSSRKSSTKALESFLRLSEVAGIFNRLPVRIGVEVSQPHIQSDCFACWFSFLNSLNIKAKLNVVPIGTTHNPNSLNLLQLIEMQITGSPHLKTSDFETIGESDSSSIFRQLPATGFVFYRTVCLMFFKAWETFLRCFLLAVIVESSDGTPSPFSRSLTSHRVELVCPRKLMSENFAISTQIVSPNSLVVHPVFDARIADKTSGTNSFIKPFILLLFSLKFCLKYQNFTSYVV